MNPKNEDKKRIQYTTEPILLKPACKDYLWGGNRLADSYGKAFGILPLAETWECSTHPDGISVVGSGRNRGIGLDELLSAYPELMGKRALKNSTGGQLPILIKFIDAGQNASVQVHPDDFYAEKHENGESGKAEMWYVLEADTDSKLIYGFQNDMDKESVKEALQKGSVETFLNKVSVKKDDVFYVEPGTVHAIGAGTVLVEIQQNSNITYRLYDYGRRGADGKCRDLHIEKALDVMKFQADSKPRQPMRLLKYSPGCATELLCRCRYFQVERILLNNEEHKSLIEMQMDAATFMVLVCLEGNLTISADADLFVKKGDTVFVPASGREIRLCGNAHLLKIKC